MSEEMKPNPPALTKAPMKAKPKKKAPVKKEAAPAEPKAPAIKRDDSINEGDPTEKTRKALQGEKKVTIRINSTEQDKEDVFVAVNGFAFTIQRDKDVEIPFTVYQVLMDAKTSVYRQVKREDGEGMQMIETEIQRFSMSARF